MPSEKDFHIWLKKKIESSKIKADYYKQPYAKEEAFIVKIKSDQLHPYRRDCRPDLTVWHQPVRMRFRELSNPFFIEPKLDLKEGFLQALRNKYAYKREIGLEKYGRFHSCLTSPEFFFRRTLWSEPKIADYIERTLWKMGLGVVYKSNYEKDVIVVAFNEAERLYLVPKENKGYAL